MAFLATIAPIISAVGTVASGLFSAQVANNNAKVAEQNAVYAGQAGTERATVTAMKGAAKEAHLKTAIAANGIDVNTGSSVDVEQSARMADQLDIETMLHEAGLEAYGYRTQEANYKAQATQDTIGAIFGGASDLFSGAKAVNWGTGSGTATTSGDIWAGASGAG